MANFCLPKEFTQKFLEGLKKGSIDPLKMSEMTSEKRREYLKKYVGEENASSVNALFESKLLLKNQKAGMIDWAKTVAGLKPEARTDMIKKIENLETALTPENKKAFLNDLVEQKLGIGVTAQEAKTIFELSKKVTDAKDISGIKKIEDVIAKLDTLPKDKMTDVQVKSLESLKEKINNQKAKEEALAKFEEAEAQRVKAEKKAEQDALRKEAQNKRAEENARLRAERETARQKVRDEKRAEREQLKQDVKDARESVGGSIKKLRTVFGENLPLEVKSEIQNIVELKRQAQNDGEDRLVYGRAKVALDNYTNGLLDKSFVQQFKERPLSTVAGTAKSLKASLDNSAIFRQGWKSMFTNPDIWQRNARKSFSDIARTLGGKETLDEVRADIVSRPTYDKMKTAKLAVGTTEEAFPSSLPEKVPLLGRVYKASENAFTGFVYRQRADIFDKYLSIAEKSGVDINDKYQLESIGKLVNSLTGRGSLGRFEGSGANLVNNVFFSPRSLKATVDTLTLHAGDDMSSFARKQSAQNLVKIVAGIATIMAIAHAIKPDSVELDPRSSDFGKIKVGNTRFDISGGMSSLVVLASRLVPALWGKGMTKSTTTHKLTPINSGKFGAQTGTDVLYSFAENKLSPVASIAKDLLKGTDFNGNKVTVLGEANNLLTPLPITNAYSTFKDPKSANLLLVMIADGLGIGTNTYGAQKKKK